MYMGCMCVCRLRLTDRQIGRQRNTSYALQEFETEAATGLRVIANNTCAPSALQEANAYISRDQQKRLTDR